MWEGDDYEASKPEESPSAKAEARTVTISTTLPPEGIQSCQVSFIRILALVTNRYPALPKLV